MLNDVSYYGQIAGKCKPFFSKTIIFCPIRASGEVVKPPPVRTGRPRGPEKTGLLNRSYTSPLEDLKAFATQDESWLDVAAAITAVGALMHREA